MWFSGKVRARAAVLVLAMGFGSVQAQYVIDYIDFNKQWLRQDAYNRAMNHGEEEFESARGFGLCRGF